MKFPSVVLFVYCSAVCLNVEAGRWRCTADTEKWSCGFYYNYLMILLSDTARNSEKSGLWFVSGIRREEADKPILISQDALSLEESRMLGNNFFSKNYEVTENRQTMLYFSSAIEVLEKCEPADVFIMLHRENQPAFIYLPSTGRINRYGIEWVSKIGC